MTDSKKITFVILTSLVIGIFTFCKKDKDSVSTQTLNGQVVNNCTDSGLASVKVFFQTIKNNSIVSSRETISGSDGVFSFGDAEIHNDNQYSYSIYIQSKSGIGANSPELTRFDGTTMSFTKDQAGTFFRPRVTPGFFRLNVVYQGTCNVNDTINPTFTQKTFHKNVPATPYEFILGTNGTAPNVTLSSANYPMGKYTIKIIKVKSSIQTTTYDSIYLGSADSKTYTINW